MNKHAVLIVDDEPAILKIMSIILEDIFDVFRAADGLEGLDIISHLKTPLSLILLDLDMPRMNGVEFLKKLRSAADSTPVIVFTGRSNHEWAMSCADLGVQGYLDKVTGTEELIGKMKRLLRMEDYVLLRSIWKKDYEVKMSSLSPPIKKALAYIQNNFQKDMTREDVAGCLGVSPQYLSTMFHTECGIHLKDYINMLKISKCKECLKDTDRKISEIGPMIGIPNANYLSRLFKKHTGITPQEFRKK